MKVLKLQRMKAREVAAALGNSCSSSVSGCCNGSAV